MSTFQFLKKIIINIKNTLIFISISDPFVNFLNRQLEHIWLLKFVIKVKNTRFTAVSDSPVELRSLIWSNLDHTDCERIIQT
jgi:hypothetical protein